MWAAVRPVMRYLAAIPIALVAQMLFGLPDWAPILIGAVLIFGLAALLMRPVGAVHPRPGTRRGCPGIPFGAM